MREKVYKTVIQVEILSEGPYRSELPIDKILSSIEYDGAFGHNSNFITVIEEKELSQKELELECAKHGTDPTFFTGLEQDLFEEVDEHESELGI